MPLCGIPPADYTFARTGRRRVSHASRGKVREALAPRNVDGLAQQALVVLRLPDGWSSPSGSPRYKKTEEITTVLVSLSNALAPLPTRARRGCGSSSEVATTE